MIPSYLKYAKSATQSWLDQGSKLKPSDLSKPSLDVNPDDYPLITKFNNIVDCTNQIHSTVEIDLPIFQPAPKIVVFDNYQPFAIVKKRLFFRNKDSVGRRIKLIKPDTPFFEISAPQTISGEPLQQSKIAAGMEVSYVVTFKPQEVRDYAWDLECVTERETFIVPLRAIGMRPLLTLPDEIDFGPCPIKAPSEKKVVIRNIGSSVAKFKLVSWCKHFICPEQDIAIEANASFGLELSFVPNDTSFVRGEIEVLFNDGIKCFIGVQGIGKNVDVSLSSPSIVMEPSYISLCTQKTLRIKNLSDAPVRFRWKSFSTDSEENVERSRLLEEINRIECAEIIELKNLRNNKRNVEGFSARAEEAILARKYENLRKALSIDKMLFVDDIFDISPIEGEVWAHSDIEVTVCFKPDTAAQYNCLAFLDVSGRNDRLPLQLVGSGIGPQATLSFEVLDIGDIFINDINYYRLIIKNKGDIPAQWNYVPAMTQFGSKFTLNPVEGYLLPNQSTEIGIRFECDILGEFVENFRFALQGNDDMLICQLRGHVIGPTFHFDCKSIEFGTVSFDYLHSSVIKLVNTSKVPMVYSLGIPQDGTYLKKEFNLEPNNGTLSPQESVEITIEFIPTTVKIYDYSLSVDILGVGENVFSIPIHAECIVSAVKLDLPTREIDFGDCFIRYPYEVDLNILNLSGVVFTKFEVLPQPKHTLAIASYEVIPAVAVIEPSSSLIVKVRLIGQKLGSYKIPLAVTIAGSQEPPIQAILSFNIVGPKVIVGNSELKWGNIECLKDHSRTVTISNVGLISASMKLFLKMARSCYKIDIKELSLEAHQSFELDVVANLDDSVVTKDEIHIMVDEGDNLMIPLVAKGIGTTMHCAQSMDVLDLGIQLTSVPFEKQIVLENKGRRPQQLRWTNKTIKVENASRLLKAKKLGKDTSVPSRLPKNLAPMDPYFTVIPEEITLRPRTATTFTFRGISNSPKLLSEQFILESKVGKERNMKIIMETEVKCQIVDPLLKLSTNEIQFSYVWERNVEPQIQKSELSFINNSSLPLTFVLKTEIPFNLSSYEQTLQPSQSCTLFVDFDPLYRDDRVSHVVEKNLQISYRGHPQKDFVKLVGEVTFPNLKFDINTINFGCVLNDTSKSLKLKSTNYSKVDVSYEWTFLEQTTSKVKTRNAVFSTPPSHIFDILPVKSKISPGDSEEIEFTMIGMNNCKLSSTVVCNVEGGPEYKFQISGESSNVAYELDRDIVSFGKVVFTGYGEGEICIFNRGKVAFNFSLTPNSLKDSEHLEFFPQSGKIAASQQLKIVIRFHPGFPKMVHASFNVQVGHFDPVNIQCYGEGIFQTALIGLPRYKKFGPFIDNDGSASSAWEILYEMAIKCITQKETLSGDVGTVKVTQESSLSIPSYSEPFVFENLAEHESDHVIEQIADHTNTLTKSSPVTVDIEMQRIVLCHKIEELLHSANLITTVQSSSLLSTVLNTSVDIKSIVTARYSCDFGNVVIGQTRKKIFKVTNISTVGPLSWIFDKKNLAASGFSIEPEKVMKLGETDSLDVTVKFFARSQLKVGPKLCVVPMEIPGSATIHIILLANVCLPEITLSAAEVDFGKVLLGTSVKTYVRLHNPSPVSATWTLKQNGGKEEPRFFIEPLQGFLKPNKKCTICIEYLPTANCRNVSNYVLKIDQNKKMKQFKLIGEGFVVPIIFDPPSIELSPILPQTVGEQIITISNPCDVPAEIFSVDFDQQYKEEEKLLLIVDQYDKHGCYRCDVRNPGETLPRELQNLVQKETISSNLTDSAVLSQSEPQSLRTPPLRTLPASRDTTQQQDIAILGLPLSGASTLSHNLSRKLLLPVKRIDDLFLEVAGVDHPLGLLARKFVDQLSESEKLHFRTEEETLLAAAEQSKIDAVEAFKKEKKGKVKEIPEEVYKTEAVDRYKKYMEEYDKSSTNISKIFQFRSTWKDLGDGIIIDNVETKFCDFETLFESLKVSFPDLITVSVSIDGGERGYFNWIKHIFDSNKLSLATLSKSIDANKKNLMKLLKSANVKEIDSIMAKLDSNDNELLSDILVLNGDEIWIDAFSGKVVEIDGNDYKSLEDKDKIRYLEQLIVHHGQLIVVQQQALDRSIHIIGGEAELTNDDFGSLDSKPWKSLFDEYKTQVQPKLEGLKASDGLFCEVLLSGDELIESVLQSTMALLPPPKISVEERENKLPPNEVYQIYRKPTARPNKKTSTLFKIDGIHEIDSTANGLTRWIVPAQGEVQFKLVFRSEKEGNFETSLDFEVVGTGQKISLPCKAISEYPKINTDTKALFMRRAKVLNVNNPYPSKRYIISEQLYSFGALALFKKPDWKKIIVETTPAEDVEKYKVIEATNSDLIRLTNIGKYKCIVNIAIETDGTSTNSAFSTEINKLEIDEGETKDVRMWALPLETKEYSGNLVINVMDNPETFKYPIKCWGSDPSIELIGPWTSAIAAATEAVAKNTDKKLMKELEAKLSVLKEFYTIDFSRVLIGKNEIRKFTITNKSLIPVAWEISPEDFADSTNVSFSPNCGELAFNSSIDVEVNFTSAVPLILEGKFSLKYSDVEGGLKSSRVVSNKFKLVAEAYKITAVSFDSQGNENSGSSKVNFGTIRVGDNAVQTVKMGNKGKYKIGFNCEFTTPRMSELVKIEPLQGTIEPGSAVAELKITFCSPLEELQLKDNCDIIIHINEPLTNEVVEKFPLMISAYAKYNKFRVQPLKGITFGAVRFDADAPCKKAEIRNESEFEISFAILPASSEHEELDGLDSESLSYYAYYVPAAMRAKELGDNYMTRLGSTDKGGGKKDKAPKGKKDAPVEPVAALFNPLVRDPDGLSSISCPPNPLTVGSFSISPRIGSILPGQSVSIDVKFDPSVCKTVKEKLRVCVGGADPSGVLTTTLKGFELIGESCLPALVCDDYTNIFEEQEVVSSLAEISRDGKLEKVPVGKAFFCEKERMLAFGPVSCVQTGRGVCERVKIMNPTKIDIKAKFRVANLETSADKEKTKDSGKGKDAKPKKGASEPAVADIPLAFSIQPESWEIPPHEFRFVNVYFQPFEIKSFRSLFIGEIDDEGTTALTNQSAAKALQFELGGSGALPYVSVVEPITKNVDGGRLIQFGKVLVQKTSKKIIKLHNDGVMTATCLFELKGDNDNFKFPANGTSVTLQPGESSNFDVIFSPLKLLEVSKCDAVIKVTVLNNPFDQYSITLAGEIYSCDATINLADGGDDETTTFTLPDVNLTTGSNSSESTLILSSLCSHQLKFDFQLAETLLNSVSVIPSQGHLAPNAKREIVVRLNATETAAIDKAKISCALQKIEYKLTSEDSLVRSSEESLWGKWDNNMKSLRPAQPQDMQAIEEYARKVSEYQKSVEAEKAKGKKGKPVGPPPEKCSLQIAPPSPDGSAMVYEIVQEPFHNISADYKSQELQILCSGIADTMEVTCDMNGETLSFVPTYMFQSASFKFNVQNKSKISVPMCWAWDYSHSSTEKRRIPKGGAEDGFCPFSIELPEAIVPPVSSTEFTVKFSPLDAGEYESTLKGFLVDRKDDSAIVTVMFRAIAKRPICHFEIKESSDYLSRRLPNMKNENGLYSSIEDGMMKIVEVESVGLRTRNSFRFYVTNASSESYEFLWESLGEPSPFWRCVQSAGMMFPGKRIEMLFEYLPEDTNIAESFYKFSIPRIGLFQNFLFVGKVSEPKVNFSVSKVDFHSVMLGGEGITETVYLENREHLPFNFSFDKYSLLQLEGPNGSVLEINPREGTVPPGSRIAINLYFKPQEEVIYNYNLACLVKRKPNKLNINVKGEGYSVHPQIQLENTLSGDGTSSLTDKYMILKSLPTINNADFGSVQVLDTVTKNLSLLNTGKYNFDYSWNLDHLGNMLSLTGGKINGTLLKGEEINYKLTFAPQYEGQLSGCSLVLTVAGKYSYSMSFSGQAIKPALKFSFMKFDFGPCFITSPGGTTVTEETCLVLKNQDTVSNISVECLFQKTRALWLDFSPAVISPGKEISIPILFSPREVKEYSFVIPFLINGTSKVSVFIQGSGIVARLELVNGSQRRTAFGLVNVGNSVSRTIVVVNKSKKALPFQLLQSGEYNSNLQERFISFEPSDQCIIQPKETIPIIVKFSPTKRLQSFSEDLMVKCAGILRPLVTLSGKAQGIEVNLDSDSIPFGTVVLNSQKVKKLTLENLGDLTINYQWDSSTFGPHFLISPISGKLLPGNETTFDVIFKPQFVNDDIRQESIGLSVFGGTSGGKNGKSEVMETINITCSGVCILPPPESTQKLQFNSSARKNETKTIKITNNTERNWFLSPSLEGLHWKVPHEFKVPLKGVGELPITYFPLTMSSPEKPHVGKLFLALPDGTANLYELSGVAGPPICSEVINIESPAKKSITTTLKVENWLGCLQKFDVSAEIVHKSCPATFVTIANATEVGPNGTKEFPVRFVSYAEGASKVNVKFTNSESGEYCFFEINVKVTESEILEVFSVDSPVRQTARFILNIENPLNGAIITMGAAGKSDWWQCNSKYVRVNELTSLSANKEGCFEVSYRPLVVTQQPEEYSLTVVTQELGTFKYKIVAKASPSILKQTLRFEAPLGGVQTENFQFRTYNLSKTDFSCNISNQQSSFLVQKSFPVEASVGGWEGDEVKLPINFEPTEIGEFRDSLMISSNEFGHYQCELVGVCIPPVPQGPYLVEQGGNPVEIMFRNCFTVNCSWSCRTDSSAFKLIMPTTAEGFPVNAKAEFKCSVGFDPSQEQIASAGGIGSFIAAKMMISCDTKPQVPPWIFYLRGKITGSSNSAPSKGKK